MSILFESLNFNYQTLRVISQTNNNDNNIKPLTTITDILRQRTKDVEVKKYCISLLEKFGSFVYTRNVLNDLNKQARDEIQRLGGNPFLVSVLDELLSWKEASEKED